MSSALGGILVVLIGGASCDEAGCGNGDEHAAGATTAQALPEGRSLEVRIDEDAVWVQGKSVDDLWAVSRLGKPAALEGLRSALAGTAFTSEALAVLRAPTQTSMAVFKSVFQPMVEAGHRRILVGDGSRTFELTGEKTEAPGDDDVPATPARRLEATVSTKGLALL